MKTTHLDILLMVLANTDINTNLKTPNNSVIDEIAKTFATTILTEEQGENAKLNTDFEQQVNQQKHIWKKYLEDVVDAIKEGIKIFQSYDHNKRLEKLFDRIKTGKHVNPHTLPKYTNIMIEYAMQAYENEVWNDAYFMLSFVTTYVPDYVPAYLPLGLCIEELKGLDQASEFYRITCEILKDPDLYFFAADCELNRNNKDKAKEYLLKIKEILGNAASLSEEHQELLSDANEILEALEQAA